MLSPFLIANSSSGHVICSTSPMVPGQKLYDILVRPAQKLIPANSSVVILPDSKLNGPQF